MFIVMFPIAKTCSSDGFEELSSVSLGFGRKFKSLYFHEGHKHSMGWHANRMKNCELDVVKDRKKKNENKKISMYDTIRKKKMRLNEWQSCLLSYLWNITVKERFSFHKYTVYFILWQKIWNNLVFNLFSCHSFFFFFFYSPALFSSCTPSPWDKSAVPDCGCSWMSSVWLPKAGL